MTTPYVNVKNLLSGVNNPIGSIERRMAPYKHFVLGGTVVPPNVGLNGKTRWRLQRFQLRE